MCADVKICELCRQKDMCLPGTICHATRHAHISPIRHAKQTRPLHGMPHASTRWSTCTATHSTTIMSDRLSYHNFSLIYVVRSSIFCYNLICVLASYQVASRSDTYMIDVARSATFQNPTPESRADYLYTCTSSLTLGTQPKYIGRQHDKIAKSEQTRSVHL